MTTEKQKINWIPWLKFTAIIISILALISSIKSQHAISLSMCLFGAIAWLIISASTWFNGLVITIITVVMSGAGFIVFPDNNRIAFNQYNQSQTTIDEKSFVAVWPFNKIKTVHINHDINFEMLLDSIGSRQSTDDYQFSVTIAVYNLELDLDRSERIKMNCLIYPEFNQVIDSSLKMFLENLAKNLAANPDKILAQLGIINSVNNWSSKLDQCSINYDLSNDTEFMDLLFKLTLKFKDNEPQNAHFIFDP